MKEFDAFVNENTPKIFHKKTRSIRTSISLMPLFYFAFIELKKIKTQESLELQKAMKKEILSKIKHLSLRYFPLKGLTVFILIKFCPSLYPFIRLCYRAVKKLVGIRK